MNEKFKLTKKEHQELSDSMEAYTQENDLSLALSQKVKDINQAINGVFSSELGVIMFPVENENQIRLREIYLDYISKLNEIVNSFIEDGIEGYDNPKLLSYIKEDWGLNFARLKAEIENMPGFDKEKFAEFSNIHRTENKLEADNYLTKLSVMLNNKILKNESIENIVLYCLYTINSIIAQAGNGYVLELEWANENSTKDDINVAKYTYIRIMRDLVYVADLVNKSILLP